MFKLAYISTISTPWCPAGTIYRHNQSTNTWVDEKGIHPPMMENPEEWPDYFVSFHDDLDNQMRFILEHYYNSGDLDEDIFTSCLSSIKKIGIDLTRYKEIIKSKYREIFQDM